MCSFLQYHGVWATLRVALLEAGLLFILDFQPCSGAVQVLQLYAVSDNSSPSGQCQITQFQFSEEKEVKCITMKT